ncbi:hypothetical protein SAMN05444422_10148 [Halobiforma haloterrestris]|uniref:Uncharacterized protein n=1 Tax=Natronobacterium haloterrestre TaxID=148448 RepID=A0A1I1CZI3_NATHA|nr:hypothetical protein SAMN05444422_10148 [Halobiforma haloterrestris]
MYLGIDVHKRYAQVAVMGDAGKIVEEVRAENANLFDGPEIAGLAVVSGRMFKIVEIELVSLYSVSR